MMTQSDTAATEENTLPARDRLLVAVIDIGGRRGLEAVTYRAVAAEAGVAHGLVRHYFGSREAMLGEALKFAVELDRTTSGIAPEVVSDFAPGFAAHLSSTWPRQMFQLEMTMAAVRGRDDLLPLVHEQYEQYRASLSASLSGWNIEDVGGRWSAMLLAILDGLILQHRLYGSESRTDHIVEQVRALLTLAARSESLGRDC